jgi:HD-GYP domain-containing protein (c-di-GMP phosphodiesterase class II)
MPATAEAPTATLIMRDPRTEGALPVCRLIGSLGVRPLGEALSARSVHYGLEAGERDLVGGDGAGTFNGNPLLQGAVEMLLAAVDAKDSYTGGHSRRVTRIALRLGRATGLSTPALRLLEFAALTHDVGKIGVPEATLRKAGGLTAKEWVEMRRHPVVSAEIVAHMSDFREVAAVVRHHHERYDGGGYPDGLQAERIPYLARIIALADTFDAMTTKRTYGNPVAPAQAMEIIRENLGSQFDPLLGRLFLTLDADAVWSVARGMDSASRSPAFSRYRGSRTA